MQLTFIREDIERRRRQILRQRREIRDLQRAGIPTKSADELLAQCADRDQLVGEQRIRYPGTNKATNGPSDRRFW